MENKPGIPKDWEKRTIKDVVNIGNGKDYKHLGQGQIPVYGTGGIMTYVDSYLYEGESVGIGRKGTIDKPVFLQGKFWTVDTLFYTHSFKNCLPKFLYYLFLTIDWKNYNEASGVPSLSKSTIELIDLLLPPLPEQQKIAAILSKWDEAIEAQTQLIAAKETQKKALMQKLLTGEVRFPGFEEEWDKCRLKDISILVTKGTTPTSLGFNFETKGVNFIKAENINNFGEIEIESTPKISEECNLKLKRSQLEINDIVFSIAGTLGRTAIIQKKDLPANTNQALAIIRLKNAEPQFVNFCLNTPAIEKYIKEMVSVGAQPNINLEQINEIKIPFPSNNEQVKITGILYRMESEIKQLKTELEALHLQKKGLMQELLTGKIRVRV